MEYARRLIEDLIDSVDMPVKGEVAHLRGRPSDKSLFQATIRITGPNNSVSPRNVGSKNPARVGPIDIEPDIQIIDVNFTRKNSSLHSSADAVRGSIFFSLDLDSLIDDIYDSVVRFMSASDNDHIEMEMTNLWRLVLPLIQGEYVHGIKSKASYISFEDDKLGLCGHVHAHLLG